MATTEEPDYDRLNQLLAGTELAPSPAEAQAMLCGLLALYRPDARQCWHAQLQAPAADESDADQPLDRDSEPAQEAVSPTQPAAAPAALDITHQGCHHPVPEATAPPARDAALEGLADWTEAALDAQSLAFDLLLPPEDRPLRERATAVHDWVRGLLFGLALGGLQREQLQGQALEAFDDLVELTRMDMDAVAESEADEEALAEIVEFLRIAAMLIREERAKTLAEERNRQAAETGLH